MISVIPEEKASMITQILGEEFHQHTINITCSHRDVHARKFHVAMLGSREFYGMKEARGNEIKVIPGPVTIVD